MKTLPRHKVRISMAILLAAAPLLAQTPARPARQPARDEAPAAGQVLMLEEIRIQVAPELPTVVVSIPRQRPVIKSVGLAKDAGDLITAGNAQVKPRLADLQVKTIDEPQKILAKTRTQ